MWGVDGGVLVGRGRGVEGGEGGGGGDRKIPMEMRRLLRISIVQYQYTKRGGY